MPVLYGTVDGGQGFINIRQALFQLSHIHGLRLKPPTQTHSHTLFHTAEALCVVRDGAKAFTTWPFSGTPGDLYSTLGLISPIPSPWGGVLESSKVLINTDMEETQLQSLRTPWPETQALELQRLKRELTRATMHFRSLLFFMLGTGARVEVCMSVCACMQCVCGMC